MNADLKPIRIAVTGPESTGKTTLAQKLANRFSGLYIPEYAREYVENLPEDYTFKDVENIARKQIDEYNRAGASGCEYVFFDTWLIITKVWFQWVFGEVPDWLEDKILNCPIDLFLLCRPDLPWVADPVRENGGESRIRLYKAYRSELIHYGFNFIEIEGTDDARLKNAEAAIKKYIHSEQL